MRLVGIVVLLLAVTLWTRAVQADVITAGGIDVGLMVGGGMERGAGRGGSAVTASPLIADLNLRAHLSEGSGLSAGGSIRYELTGAGAVGFVPRLELRHAPGGLELRPGLGLALHLSPMTLIGPEVSLGARLPLSQGLGLQAMVFVDAFLAGSNLPRNTTLIQLGLCLGVDLRL